MFRGRNKHRFLYSLIKNYLSCHFDILQRNQIPCLLERFLLYPIIFFRVKLIIVFVKTNKMVSTKRSFLEENYNKNKLFFFHALLPIIQYLTGAAVV
jgi:hypothetical protein